MWIQVPHSFAGALLSSAPPSPKSQLLSARVSISQVIIHGIILYIVYTNTSSTVTGRAKGVGKNLDVLGDPQFPSSFNWGGVCMYIISYIVHDTHRLCWENTSCSTIQSGIIYTRVRR